MQRAFKAPKSPFTADDPNSNLVLGTTKAAKTALKGAFLLDPGKTVPKPVPEKNSYRKRFVKQKTPYKLPSIVRSRSGDWFIKYFYELPDHPGKFKEFRVRDGVNYIHDPQHKEKEIVRLLGDIRYALEKEGFNPFSQEVKVKRQIAAKKREIQKLTERREWTLSDALARYREYIKTRGLAIRTIRSYHTYLAVLERWIAAAPGRNVLARDFAAHDLAGVLDHAGAHWTPRTYNNFSKYFVTFFNHAQKLEKRENRGVHYAFDGDELDLKIDRPQRNMAYTAEQIAAIKQAIEKQPDPGFAHLRDYCEWITLSAMRPAEIRELRAVNIDVLNRQIRINGKTGDRIIPVSDQLLRLVEKRRPKDAQLNDFIFGEAGRPSPRRMSKDYFPRLFTEIKEAVGLGGNHTLYGFKHTGIIMMIKAGFRDDEIRVLTGHKTQAAFEAYKRDLVIDNSHVMKGSTINF